MQDNDKQALFSALLDVGEYYGKHLGENTLNIYYQSLRGFELDEVLDALQEHIFEPGAGRFMPKVADITERLVSAVTVDDILAHAQLAKTPLGILARIHIGTADLKRNDHRYLSARARECALLLPAWRKKVQRQLYTPHELSMLEKYGVPKDSSLLGDRKITTGVKHDRRNRIEKPDV